MDLAKHRKIGRLLRGGADTVLLTLDDEAPEKKGQQASGIQPEGASLAMVKPAMMALVDSFLKKNAPRKPAVDGFFNELRQLYDMASLDARNELDRFGFETGDMESFPAWIQDGTRRTGRMAQEWASQIQAPLVGGSRGGNLRDALLLNKLDEAAHRADWKKKLVAIYDALPFSTRNELDTATGGFVGNLTSKSHSVQLIADLKKNLGYVSGMFMNQAPVEEVDDFPERLARRYEGFARAPPGILSQIAREHSAPVNSSLRAEAPVFHPSGMGKPSKAFMRKVMKAYRGKGNTSSTGIGNCFGVGDCFVGAQVDAEEEARNRAQARAQAQYEASARAVTAATKAARALETLKRFLRAEARKRHLTNLGNAKLVGLDGAYVNKVMRAKEANYKALKARRRAQGQPEDDEADLTEATWRAYEKYLVDTGMIREDPVEVDAMAERDLAERQARVDG